MNEINNYKQGVIGYYAARGRLPGDTSNSGIIGVDSAGNTIKIDGVEFGDHTDYDGWIPFYEMNEEGIIDFNKDTDGFGGPFTIGKISNVVKNAMYGFVYLNTDSTNGQFDEQYLNKNSLALESYYFGSIPTKYLQFIDEKTDDGDAKTGKVLSICMDYPVNNQEIYENDEYNGGSNYKNSIDKKGFCRDAYFALDI